MDQNGPHVKFATTTVHPPLRLSGTDNTKDMSAEKGSGTPWSMQCKTEGDSDISLALENGDEARGESRITNQTWDIPSKRQLPWLIRAIVALVGHIGAAVELVWARDRLIKKKQDSGPSSKKND